MFAPLHVCSLACSVAASWIVDGGAIEHRARGIVLSVEALWPINAHQSRLRYGTVQSAVAMLTDSSRLALTRAHDACFITAIAVAILLAGFAQAERPRLRPMKTHVHFLATSTLIRGTWGTNEDAYLAEITPRHAKEVHMVRLIDEYPNFFPSLSPETLTSQAGTAMTLKLDSSCDILFGEILLRTAPGDPMAVAQGRSTHHPDMGITPDSGILIPCYRTVRGWQEPSGFRSLTQILKVLAQ